MIYSHQISDRFNYIFTCHREKPVFEEEMQTIVLTSEFHKGQLGATIFKSADTAHLILLCYLGDAVRCVVLADSKMFARNSPFMPVNGFQIENSNLKLIKKL